jgi:hypothetical protein
MEKSAPGTEFVFRILRELNYNSLQASADYLPQGDLLLGIELKGMSPYVDEKRPVHFNLNLEQNLLKLLQSLRYIEGLNEELDKNVQEYYQRRMRQPQAVPSVQ